MELADNKLYLNSEELKHFKKIGQGTDGAVFKLSNDLLIKIYHINFNFITKYSFPQSKNDEDVKIYVKGKTKFQDDYYHNQLRYQAYNKEADEVIKIIPKDAINHAIARQENIILTHLPVGKVYIDGHYAGCLLVRQKGIGIHYLMGLPLSKRGLILSNTLLAVDELLENNVYHTDLANSPFAKKTVILPNDQIVRSGHSHILVNPLSLETQIIDLEGKSTTYTEKENKILRQQSLNNLTILTLEFLYKIRWSEEFFEYPEILEESLNEVNLSNQMRYKIIDQNMEMEDFYTLTRNLKR